MGLALCGVLSAATDVLQDVEPVHDLLHLHVFRQALYSGQGVLFGGVPGLLV
jgi:hypothetical protein